MYIMNRILVLAALAACGDNYATQTPDAGSLLVDATTSGDAAQRLQQGCNMGNLPASRTVTLTPSDSAPSGLLNELQDAVIGAKRTAFVRSFVPVFYFCSVGSYVAGAATSGGNIIQKSSGNTNGTFGIPFEDGDRITGLSFDGYGDGSVSVIQYSMLYGATPGAVSSLKGNTPSISPVPASWVNYPIGSVVPTVLTSSSYLYVILHPNASNLEVGMVHATFDRL